VGLRDILTGRHAVKGPAPDRLFAISTAYVTLETEHQIVPSGEAAIVFQALATSDFESTLKEMEGVVTATGGETGTTVSTQDDSYGYRWMILRSPADKPSVEDLAVGINAVSGSIETAGYGDRLLCAVFAFEDRSGARSSGGSASGGGARVYFIYNYKRGYWYPFVPARADGPIGDRPAQSDSEQERSTERELQIKAQIGSELPIEPELERWFPLWGIPI
jgi:PspA associated protein B